MCQSLSRVWLFAALWTVAHQAPLSMGFLRQEYWSGLTFSSSGGLTRFPALQADSLPSEPPGNIEECLVIQQNDKEVNLPEADWGGLWQEEMMSDVSEDGS